MSGPWSTIDQDEPCGACGRARKDHWGRKNGLAPQKLGHQWRPVGTPK